MSDQENQSPDTPEVLSQSKKPGCLTQWVGFLILVSPAILGPMSASAECGSYANESNCGAYMWPMLFMFTVPMGLITMAVGRSTAKAHRDAQQQQENPPA